MTINRVKSFQYFGLTLDETLRFNDHVDFLSSSLIKHFGIFNKVKYRITNKLARELYFAFIYSRIKYGIKVYGRCSAQNASKVQVMQNKLLKLLLRKYRMTPTDEIHENMNLLKVSDIYECNVLTFVNDIMMKRCPDSMQQYYPKRRNIYDVRVKNQLIVPQVRMSVGDRAVRVAGATLWNNMHKDMTQYRLRKWFKGRLIKTLHSQIPRLMNWLMLVLVCVWYISSSACTKHCIVLFWIKLPFCFIPAWIPSSFLSGCQQDEPSSPLTTTSI